MSTAKPSAASSDGLTQPQREAIVDLLLFAMYEDKRIAVQEDTFIEQHVRQMNWQSGTFRQTYVSMATARVRSARDTSEGRANFLRKLNEQLDTPEAKARAFEMCRELLLSDANESAEESRFESELRTLFGLEAK